MLAQVAAALGRMPWWRLHPELHLRALGLLVQDATQTRQLRKLMSDRVDAAAELVVSQAVTQLCPPAASVLSFLPLLATGRRRAIGGHS